MQLLTWAWIGWRSIVQRGLASGLTALSMALGVALVVAILLVHGIVDDSFRTNSNLGYNMIVGAKGGRLQLVLNSVYYLSQPVENIPYAYYQEFLTAERRAHELNVDPATQKDGKYSAYTLFALPICMGDYFRQWRVVGTIPEYFEHYEDEFGVGRSFEFAQGRNFKQFDEVHLYYEAVVGAAVARKEGLQVGDKINPTHGSEEGHAHSAFTVVGILASTGTPIDRGVYVNMEGFFLMDGHAKVIEEDPLDPATATPAAAPEATAAPADDAPADETSPAAAAAATAAAAGSTPPRTSARRPPPLPVEQREVTAILLRSDPRAAPLLRNVINEGIYAQAVMPVAEIYALFDMIVAPIQRFFLLTAFLICVVSGISILVSIYNSMSERRREIAIMRALGASRLTIFGVVLLEATMLALGGGLLGWLGGHGLMWLAGGWVEAQTGVVISPFHLAPPLGDPEDFAAFGFLLGHVSSELILIPVLIVLSVIVGFLPALSAYQTDVSKSLQN